MHKLNTCLFWTHKLVPMMFAIDMFSLTYNCTANNILLHVLRNIFSAKYLIRLFFSCLFHYFWKQYNTIQIFLFPIKEPFRAEQLTKNLIQWFVSTIIILQLMGHCACYIAYIRMQLLLYMSMVWLNIDLFVSSSNQCNQSIIIVLNSLLIVLPERAP
jgi:hypothetical protein